MTSMTTAASNPASRASRYVSDPGAAEAAARCALGHPLEPKPARGDLQRPGRHVHPDDLGERVVLDQLAQERVLRRSRGRGPAGRRSSAGPP